MDLIIAFLGIAAFLAWWFYRRHTLMGRIRVDSYELGRLLVDSYLSGEFTQEECRQYIIRIEHIGKYAGDALMKGLSKRAAECADDRANEIAVAMKTHQEESRIIRKHFNL